MKKPTEEREQELLKAIREAHEAKGYAPTRRDLAERIGISATRVQQLVDRCCEKGLLQRPSGVARALVIHHPEDC